MSQIRIHFEDQIKAFKALTGEEPEYLRYLSYSQFVKPTFHTIRNDDDELDNIACLLIFDGSRTVDIYPVFAIDTNTSQIQTARKLAKHINDRIYAEILDGLIKPTTKNKVFDHRITTPSLISDKYKISYDELVKMTMDCSYTDQVKQYYAEQFKNFKADY